MTVHFYYFCTFWRTFLMTEGNKKEMNNNKLSFIIKLNLFKG